MCGIDYESEWSILSSFTTPPPCTTPTDISVADITPASAVVSWQGTATAYNVKYRRLPVSTDATVVLTVGDVWEDDTGYQMLLDSDATAYGNIIPEEGPFNREGDVSDEIYSQFEYKIPENADGSLTTQNIVLNSSVSITIPAGTYDWCITNPSPGDQMWIASANGSVSGRQDNYQFEGGKVYEFTVTLDDYGNDRVDVNITTVAPSSGSVTEDEPWTLVENVTSPYTINGLVDGTMYEVEVQAVCDDGNNSQWCHSIFTTPSACAVPTALSSTDILSDGATLSWTGYQEGYNIRYRTAGESAVPFFEDFKYKGVAFFAMFYGLFSGWCYRLMRNGNGVGKCLYVYVVYVLALQFFQENVMISIVNIIQFIFFVTLIQQQVFKVDFIPRK